MRRAVAIVPFAPAHVASLRTVAEPGLPELAPAAGHFAELARGGFAWTVTLDGAPIACGGVARPPAAPWRGFAWMLAAPPARRWWPAILHHARVVLADAESLGGVRRIDATARADFPGGCLVLERLGFVRYGILRAYGADGATHFGYERVAA